MLVVDREGDVCTDVHAGTGPVIDPIKCSVDRRIGILPCFFFRVFSSSSIFTYVCVRATTSWCSSSLVVVREEEAALISASIASRWESMAAKSGCACSVVVKM
jgi:hypothetical protein